MADKTALVDTSILIDYYRKTDKNKTSWIALVRQGYNFSISTITKYEIYSGATPSQLIFWNTILQSITVISLNESCIDTAVTINAGLKRKRKQIDLADLLMAATAVTHALLLATLNKKHFDRIDELSILN